MNKFWRATLWTAPLCLSFSAYHSRSLNTAGILQPERQTQESKLPQFILEDEAWAPLEPPEGNWLVNAKMIRSIASRAVQLQSFDLSDCHALDTTAFSSLTSLKHLQHLSVARTTVSDEDLFSISQIVTLQALNLLGCCIGDRGVQALSSLTQLKHLYIGGPWYHSSGAKRIPSTVPTFASWSLIGSRLLQLETLHIRCLPLSSESHDALGSLESLKSLIIVLGVDCPDLTPLISASSSMSWEAPIDLKFLARMANLTHLRLDTLNILTPEGASLGLASKHKLESLHLPNCDLTLAVYPFIQHLSLLLNISCLRCSISIVKIIQAFPALAHFECADGICDGDLEHEEVLYYSDHTGRDAETAISKEVGSSVLSAVECGSDYLNRLDRVDAHRLEIQRLHNASPSAIESSLGFSSPQLSHALSSLENHSLDCFSSIQLSKINSCSLEPIFRIPSLTRLEHDLLTASEYFESIQAASSSLLHLSIYDDEEEEVRSAVQPVFYSKPVYSSSLPSDIYSPSSFIQSNMPFTTSMPALQSLTSLISYTASQRSSWTNVMLSTFSVSKNLVYLSLSTGKPGTLDFAFDAALSTLTKLRSLELRNFKHIASLDCIPLLTCLQSLVIVGYTPDFTGKVSVFNSISQSSSIKHLGFPYCSDITDADLRTVLKKMTQLEELDLTSLQRITDRSLHRLSRPTKGLKNLTVIRLKYCPLITTQGLLSLAKLRRLYQIETTVQSRYLYAQDQSQIDLLFSKFSSSFVSTN